MFILLHYRYAGLASQASNAIHHAKFAQVIYVSERTKRINVKPNKHRRCREQSSPTRRLIAWHRTRAFAGMHARATRCVATRGDAPTRGRSGGHAIRAHSISVSRKRKPAWRSSRRARRSHAARRPTHARTHARTSIREISSRLSTLRRDRMYASTAKLGIYLRSRSRIAARADALYLYSLLFIFMLDSGVICHTIVAAATAASPANRSAPPCARPCAAPRVSSTRVCTSYSASIRRTTRGCSSSSFSASPACCWSPASSPQGATTSRRKSLDRDRNRAISPASDDRSMTHDKNTPPHRLSATGTRDARNARV